MIKSIIFGTLLTFGHVPHGVINAEAIDQYLGIVTQSQTQQAYNCQYGQCMAIAKSTGQRCQHCVSNPGDLYCWQHQ